MKHRLILAAALGPVCLSLAPAYGQDSGSAAITVSGTSQPICRLSTGQQTSGSNASFSAGKLQIDNLIDPATANVKAASVEIKYEAMCNYSSSVSISTLNAGLVPLVPVTDPDSGFMDKVPYTVTGTWGSLPLPALNTTAVSPASSVTKASGGARRGSLLLTVSTSDSGTPLVAGSFSDTIEVKVGPTP